MTALHRILFIAVVFFSLRSFATYTAANSAGNLTVNGFAYNSGAAFTDASATATVQIKDQTSGCVLYTETISTFSINNGAYSITLGSNGTLYGSYSSLSKIFDTSNTSITGNSCTANGSTAQYAVVITNMSGTFGTYVSSGTPLVVPITSVPFAVSSAMSQSLDTSSSFFPGSTTTFLRGDGTFATPTGGSGTVSSIVAGTGLSGGTITSTGTIAIANSGVTSGTYGSTSTYPLLTINSQGQVTSASNQLLSASNISTGTLGLSVGGTGATSASGAFTNIVAPGGTLTGTISGGTLAPTTLTIPSSTSGANLTNILPSSFATAVPVSEGGTGSTTASAARTSLGAAASGPNTDITSLQVGSGSATAPSYSFSAATSTGLFSSGGVLGFSINGISTMVINSSGNVGIGTTVPSYPLTVSGTANATTFLMKGSTSAEAAQVTNAAELVNLNTTSSLSSSVTQYLASGAVMYYTAAASGNFTLNWTWSTGTSMNTAMSVGDSVTAVLMVTNGSTGYYPTAFSIDSTTVVPKWQGGITPSAGDANSIDAYTCTIIKTASAVYTVLCAQTQYQ